MKLHVRAEGFFPRLAALRNLLMSACNFCRWHEAWAEANVSEAQSRSVEDWFMGRCEGLVPNNTRRVTKADPDTTPYRTFHKYKNFKQMK